MNCREFNEGLYEYLDGTTGPEDRAAAQEHLRACPDCRRALALEQATAQFLRQSLTEAVQDVSWRGAAAMRNALETRAVPVGFRLWHWFIAEPLRWAGAGVATLGLLLLLYAAGHLHHPGGDYAASSNIPDGSTVWVIDVPLQGATHSFQRQNNTVLDAVAPSRATAYAVFAAK